MWCGVVVWCCGAVCIFEEGNDHVLILFARYLTADSRFLLFSALIFECLTMTRLTRLCNKYSQSFMLL